MKASLEKTAISWLSQANKQQEDIRGFHARNGERVSSIIKGVDPVEILRMVSLIIEKGAGPG